ncbi:MAG: fasciclin domain-containing protein [bacterium]|nr:fasciclin domain-containing protein [bacterium]
MLKHAAVILILATLAITVAFAAPEKTVVGIAASDESFSTLVTAVKAAGLADVLEGEGPFTVFAPTNDAFAALPEGTLDELLKPENKAKLQSILLYHVVPGEIFAKDALKAGKAKTATTNQLIVDFSTKEEKAYVNGAKITATDIKASNGVIHVIDSVILPPSPDDLVDTAVKAGTFKTLTAAVKAAGLVDVLKGKDLYTVFAPTDEAFAALPEGTVENLLKPENIEQLKSILLYHVVPGKVISTEAAGLNSAKTASGSMLEIDSSHGVTVNGAHVTAADIEASNGVIHVIDHVLIPPAAMTSAK